MKFTSLTSLLVLLVCLWGARCEEDVEVAVEEKIDSAEFADIDDALEIGEEITEESAVEPAEEKTATWGDWFSGLIWGSEDAAAPSEETPEEFNLDDDHCTDCDGEEHCDDAEEIQPSADVSTGKRNVKKIVILTVVIVIAVLAVLALVSVYLAKRNQGTQAPKPIVSA